MRTGKNPRFDLFNGFEVAAYKPQLAAIENNLHPDRVGNPAQVGEICRKLSGKYPGDGRLPDTGCFADCLLGYSALFRYFGKAGGDEFRVVHKFISSVCILPH